MTIDITPSGIAAALDGVTDGPWTQYHHATAAVESHKGRNVCSAGGYADNHSNGRYAEENLANARFIAYAREAVPELAAENARLRDDVDRLEREISGWQEMVAIMDNERINK